MQRTEFRRWSDLKIDRSGDVEVTGLGLVRLTAQDLLDLSRMAVSGTDPLLKLRGISIDGVWIYGISQIMRE